MTWTYDPSISTDTDEVRLLIGDTDTTDQLLQNEEIGFFLTQASDVVLDAAARSARAIAGQFARRVDSSVESVRSAASQKKKHYTEMAAMYEGQLATKGAGLGIPIVGGISKDTMRDVREDTDRVEPKFEMDKYANPPFNTVDPLLGNN